ncbi:MAG: thiamine-phosphate kinase [Rhodocyclaceae bacterium]|nr:thiamine-phosphate kinase [Rhodocyclaceae bacterium]
MAASEFDLIARYFTRPTPSAVVGVGDDAAVLAPTPGHELLVSTDMLVEGTHFLPGTDPENLGWKALAVNVSDIAAMGGQPRWATLALALPAVDEPWLAAFATGFFACAEAYGVELIGGDTTRGPLNLSVTILGEAPTGQALRRDGAKPGDDIWVSGQPGRAAQGLAWLQGRSELPEPSRSECIAALERPQPQLALGQALRGIASACIDVSDGLLADLGHILERSQVAAALQIAVLPAPTCGSEYFLAGGDDYELVFTAPRDKRATIDALGCVVSRIGIIESGTPGAPVVRDAQGNDITPHRRGYDHFG